MTLSRGAHKIERVTITLVPVSEAKGFQIVPSTFDPAERSYGWRHYHRLDYMLVPKKIASNEIKIDVFLDVTAKGKLQAVELQKAVHNLVDAKLHSEWKGLKLAGISRATAATLPEQKFMRGTIEDILGTNLKK